MQWSASTRTYWLTRSRFRIRRTKRRFFFSPIILSFWAWTTCFRMSIVSISSWSTFVVGISMITSITKSDFRKKWSNSMLLKWLWLLATYTTTPSFIEIWNQKMFWSMRLASSILQISAYQSSCNRRLNKHTPSVEQQNIWLLKYWTKKDMDLQLIGGLSVSWCMKWQLEDLPSCTRIIIR